MTMVATMIATLEQIERTGAVDLDDRDNRASRLERIEQLADQIERLEAKRRDLRDQLYAVAGAVPQADRERAITTIDRQLDRLHVERGSLILADEADVDTDADVEDDHATQAKPAPATLVGSTSTDLAPIWSCELGRVVAHVASKHAVAALVYLPAGQYLIGGDDHEYDVSRVYDRCRVFCDYRDEVAAAANHLDADDSPEGWNLNLV